MNSNRVKVCILLLLLAVISTNAQILYNIEELQHKKSSIKTAGLSNALAKLQSDCDKYLTLPAISVTYKKNLAQSKDIHDFCTLAIYTWPDSTRNGGVPYITKDGCPNPEHKNYDYPNVSILCDRINQLALCWFYTDETKYADKALELVKVWFLDKSTKMNPNLKYCQITPGLNNGYGFNVFDGIYIARMLDGISLLERYKGFKKKDRKNMRKWVKQLQRFIETYDFTNKYLIYNNNHGENYDIQQMYYMIYSGQKKKAKKYAKTFADRLLSKQVAKDGSLPLETSRPRGYHYSWLTLEYITDIVLIAKNLGIDIKNDMTKEGVSYIKVVDYLSQYIGKPKSIWPFKEIGIWEEEQDYASSQLYRIAYCIDSKYKPLLNNKPVSLNHINRLLY